MQCKFYENNLHEHVPSIKCIFLAIFTQFNFLALKEKEIILKVKITAIVFYHYVLHILYYRLCDLQIRKYVYVLEILI